MEEAECRKVIVDRVGHVRMENYNSPEVSCVSAVVASGEDGEKPAGGEARRSTEQERSPAVMAILESSQGGRDLCRNEEEEEEGQWGKGRGTEGEEGRGWD